MDVTDNAGGAQAPQTSRESAPAGDRSEVPPTSPPSDKPVSQTAEEKPLSFREAALKAGDASEQRQQSEEASQPPKESQPVTDAPPGTVAAKDEPTTEEAKPAADPVLSQEQEAALTKAFDERPEWKGILKLAGQKANEVKPLLRQVFQRETALVGQVERMKPTHALGERIQKATNDPQATKNAVALVEAWFEGRPEALEMLTELSTDLKQRLGLEVTSPDLKARLARIDQMVASGAIDAETAAEWKADVQGVEKSRATAKQAETKVQQTDVQKRQAEVKTLIDNRTKALNDWERLGPLKNPDYANRPDLRERVFNESKVLLMDREQELGRPLNPTEMVEVAQQAYDKVMKFVAGLLPKPKAEEPILEQSRSSGTGATQPKDWREAAMQAGERREARTR